MYSSEDDEQGERRKHNAHSGWLYAESLLPSQADGVALHRIIGKAERDNHQYGK